MTETTRQQTAATTLPLEETGLVTTDQAWDHELELGNDLRAEQKLVWKEALVLLLVVAVAAVRILLF